MFKKSESGRTLVEMMAVLIIIAVIIMSSLFLFNTLFKSYQRRETVKQMDTIVTGFRSAELGMKRNGKVKLKNIISGASDNTLKAANGEGTFTVKETNMENGTFTIQTTGLGLSCNDIVEEGNYTGVYAIDNEGDEIKVYDPEEAKSVAALSAICGAKHQYFLYTRGSKGNHVVPGGNGGGTGGNGGGTGDGEGDGAGDGEGGGEGGDDTPYIYSDCEDATHIKDKSGNCCPASEIVCGLCDGCPQTPYKQF